MVRIIKLLQPIEGDYGTVFEVGEIFKEDPPHGHGFDGKSFWICQGMGMHHEVKPDQFKELEPEPYAEKTLTPMARMLATVKDRDPEEYKELIEMLKQSENEI